MSAYKEFIASGGLDKDWEAFAAKKNQEIQEKWNKEREEKIQAFKSGAELDGDVIISHLKSKNVNIPLNILQVLQEDETKISLNSVTARGLGRREAKNVLKFVLNVLTE